VPRPHVAIIMIGANDVTHRINKAVAVRHLETTVRALRALDTEVVVGTCPDLGTVRPIPQPLRFVARRRSRALARRQTMAVVAAGGRAVSLGDLLGPVFTEKFDVMFGADHFHPSETGYANMVSVLVPSMAAALREHSRAEAAGTSSRDLLRLDEAAQHAGRHAGTEVTRDGRWATALRRRRAS
jgi:lysophospholipase L1-like esterase